ncbi:MAG TPA: GMC family oxidoreductase [Solimonas sp.]|nr:GMC family oxidoreductase [Solimonas sp.]
MIDDIYTAGIASGWKVHDASTWTAPRTLEADVVIVGTGAGGGTAAEILSAKGLKVLMLEEGPLKTAAHFRDMDESRAFGELYQEGAGRATSDGAVSILQGRSVGGTTTVNWTSSFRTPAPTLAHWAAHHNVADSSAAAMAPWFQQMEERLGVAPWAGAPNQNNDVLRRGCEQLGWEWHVIPRNVRGCWNSGYCGLGCPVNAKQSMLVSTIPEALRHGAELVHHLRVLRVSTAGGKVAGLEAAGMDADCIVSSGAKVTVRARHYVLAGGALNTPALLLRSQAPDPHDRLGQRTCIHPVNLSIAQMPQPVEGFYGAPQSIASDHFQWRDDLDGYPGFKLEVPPLQPGFTSTVFGRHGQALLDHLADLPHIQAMLALVRDGFHPDSPGGRVRVDDSGMPILDYEFSDYLWRGFKQSYVRMAEAQFAAGATRVMPAHLDGRWCDTFEHARDAIERLPMVKFRSALFTAHLMGGCAMGEDPRLSVVTSYGGHHQLENLSVFDGSVFPTSIGANPQLSIYGLVARNATRLGRSLGAAAAT